MTVVGHWDLLKAAFESQLVLKWGLIIYTFEL